MPELLPHDPYITAVAEALANVGFEPAEYWTCDSDTRGLHCYLNAVITLAPGHSNIDLNRWPHGLLLIWEWHPGREDGEAERGPVWLWAKCRRDAGSNEEPAVLPIDGYTNPVHVATAVGQLNDTGQAVARRAAGRWNSADALETAIAAWETP